MQEVGWVSVGSPTTYLNLAFIQLPASPLQVHCPHLDSWLLFNFLPHPLRCTFAFLINPFCYVSSFAVPGQHVNLRHCTQEPRIIWNISNHQWQVTLFFSFLLAYINCSKRFHCDISHTYTVLWSNSFPILLLLPSSL
jgi:hypothetical protein